MVDDKGPGRGRGRWTAAGVQAEQASDLEALKAAFAAHIAEHEASEGPTDGSGGLESPAEGDQG